MVKNKELIIATSKYAKENRPKSWRFLFSGLVLFMLAYAGAIVNFHVIPQIICSILAALLTVRLFIFYHDYLHGAILRSSYVAEVIFFLFGAFILAPMSIWRRSHDFHHAHNSKMYTSSIGSFPLVTKQEFLEADRIDQWIYLFSRHPLTIFLGYLFVFLWGMTIRPFFCNPKKHFDAIFALLFHYGIGTVIYLFFGWQSLLLGFFIPALISSALGAYLFYAQHNFPQAKYKSKEEWNYVFAALHSSSYMKMNKLMQWFTGNIGYHHIHHINPRIPFYNLPLVFQEMEEFQCPGTTSLLLKDIYHCFRIKVWDSERNKMIGFKEIYDSDASTNFS